MTDRELLFMAYGAMKVAESEDDAPIIDIIYEYLFSPMELQSEEVVPGIDIIEMALPKKR